ncbi:MAG: hypothetical protein Kow0067_00130 [Coriobacteriia bacterium]|jgi:K+ transport systems, NAD-binding component|nr:NAD-binding protein [Anaerosomatales bacterium]
MSVIVIANGEVAVRLGTAIEAQDKQVTFIAPTSHAAEELAFAFPRALVVHGDGRDPGVLRQARVEATGAVLSATSDDATNLSISLLAREAFSVPTVAAVVNHPHNTRTFEALGIPAVSCTQIVADALMSTLATRSVKG